MLTTKELGNLKGNVRALGSRLVSLFNALGDTNRYKLFYLLLTAKGDICVSEFAEILNISVPAASQQLKSLEVSGLITKARQGQQTCYHVNVEDPAVKMVVQAVKAQGVKHNS